MWSQADVVPGVKSVHVMKSSPNQKLLLLHHALAPVTKPTPAEATMSSDNDKTNMFKEDDWVLVNYDGTAYPGTVTTVVGGEIEVSVMERAGNTGKFCKWPVKADKIFLHQRQCTVSY